MRERLDRDAIRAWLREYDPARLEELWQWADAVRRARVGDAVHLRGLIEISNHCARDCAYCGIRRGHHELLRYRMSADEILACARRAFDLGYGTVVLQSGEDAGIGRDWMAEVVRAVKAATDLAVTLSLGERSRAELELWRAAGADRYLLRFETSDAALYARIHPPARGGGADRRTRLGWLRDLGYEVGSGVMVGIPGQSWESLVDDLELFRALDLDMIGIGPFLPHPDTPLGATARSTEPSAEQPPNDELTVCKMVALARLLCPQANIPSTTALSVLGAASRAQALARGANVIMPNLTPPPLRALYEIYPAKALVDESSEEIHSTIHGLLERLGRRPGTGQGGRVRGG